jgi:hypothetical protein
VVKQQQTKYALFLPTGRAQVSKKMAVRPALQDFAANDRFIPKNIFGGLVCRLSKLPERPPVWVQLWSR